MRKNNKGFTLIEMLIVVAIIAILVAVSIPLVSNSLERTRIATDAANERAAKAEATIMYLNDEWTGEYNSGNNVYDAATGKFIKSDGSAGEIKGYGKCTDHNGGHIIVSMPEDGTFSIAWSTGKAPHAGEID